MIAGYSEAARLDPNFALAFAGWSIALTRYFTLYGDQVHVPAEALDPALKAIQLAPDLAEGHLALAYIS